MLFDESLHLSRGPGSEPLGSPLGTFLHVRDTASVSTDLSVFGQMIGSAEGFMMPIHPIPNRFIEAQRSAAARMRERHRRKVKRLTCCAPSILVASISHGSNISNHHHHHQQHHHMTHVLGIGTPKKCNHTGPAAQ